MKSQKDHTGSIEALINERADLLFREHQNAIYKRADRLFPALMLMQWAFGVGIALWISPQTWAGSSSATHVHVWAAIILGGLISLLPIYLVFTQPGRPLTRHMVAVSQMLSSALLIHLCGGRIETHFHVFGSLAILASYRDSRVLISATIVIAADHALRTALWPQSVFGVLTSGNLRALEHAGWIIFEDIFLFITIRQSLAQVPQ